MAPTPADIREAELLARYATVASAPSIEDIERAREVLIALSERSYDGRLRDEIGRVRHALADWMDEREGEPE